MAISIITLFFFLESVPVAFDCRLVLPPLPLSMEGITLDESARIRVLSADELAAAEELRQHTDRFVETVERLREVWACIEDTYEHFWFLFCLFV